MPEALEIAGYASAILIGVALGLIGGGGSILTVPVLVYLMDVDKVTSTAYSLFIVGVTSAVGAVLAWRKGMVDVKTGILFGIPSILTVYATRQWVVPAIPDKLFTVGSSEFTKELLILGLFAVLMIVASYTMIRGRKDNSETKPHGMNYPLVLAEGVVVGLLTGLVGAGGGFLIIPALVVIGGMPMKMAIGTSLLVIAAKSLIGFTGDLGHTTIDWTLIGIFTALSTAGIFVGVWLGKFVPGSKLKPAFGWFVLVMGIYMLVREFSAL
jgi:hypothetical protein